MRMGVIQYVSTTIKINKNQRNSRLVNLRQPRKNETPSGFAESGRLADIVESFGFPGEREDCFRSFSMSGKPGI
jgi:hypothetical protein